MCLTIRLRIRRNISIHAPCSGIIRVYRGSPNRMEYKVCVVLPRAPCRGDFTSPADPPSGIRKAANPHGADSVQRMHSAGRGCLAGIEPAPAEATFRRCVTTGRFCSPWTHQAGAFRAPCNHGQGFRALDHDRCCGTGFAQRRDVGSPFAIPSTGDRAPRTRV